MIANLSTIGATQSQGGVGAFSSPGGASPVTSRDEDFGQVLTSMIDDAVDVVKTGEATAIQGLKGQASPLAVVNSVMAAQQTLHSALAIRDKVVSAYQDISRMTI